MKPAPSSYTTPRACCSSFCSICMSKTNNVDKKGCCYSCSVCMRPPKYAACYPMPQPWQFQCICQLRYTPVLVDVFSKTTSSKLMVNHSTLPGPVTCSSWLDTLRTFVFSAHLSETSRKGWVFFLDLPGFRSSLKRCEGDD